MMRAVHTLIWHCSATREGQHITVKDIRRWHVEGNGWSDIGYHKVVYLDGSVHEGRSLWKIGAHTRGHNTGSLGYCYIGGVSKDGITPKDTRTDAQRVTMIRLTREAIKVYGVTKVHGHNEFAAKACPSFNVQTDRDMLEATGLIPPSRVPILIPPASVPKRQTQTIEVQRPRPTPTPVPQEKATIWSLTLKLSKWVLARFGG